MALIHPSFDNIQRLTVPPTDGEFSLLKQLVAALDDDFLIFYEPYLNGSRPDIIILRKNCGAIIIEVKDWNLSTYMVNKHNQWSVLNNPIKSPMAQAFTYKTELFELHLPILGLAKIAEPQKNFFGVIHCFCYFHCATKKQLNNFYKPALDELKREIDDLNLLMKQELIDFKRYNKNIQYIEHKIRQLNRDKNLSYGSDNIGFLIQTIVQKLTFNPLFTAPIFDDFYRRLVPPDFILTQNIPLKLDQKQLRIATSRHEMAKVKGVAGCGKTTIIAHRVLSSYHRLLSEGIKRPQILILTYNITLCNYIEDKLTEVHPSLKKWVVLLNYHQFYLQQANNFGFNTKEQIADIMMNPTISMQESNALIAQLFQDNIFTNIEEKYQFHTIFIDEIQDFDTDWVKIIRDSFLIKQGEMVLFGDQSQNIYQQDEINKRNSSIVRGFGRWIELKKAYRFAENSQLIPHFQKFQNQFLMKEYQGNLLINSHLPIIQDVLNLNQDIISYTSIPLNIDVLSQAQQIWDNIRKRIRKYHYHPNDVIIIASQTWILKALEELIHQEEETLIMFETVREDRNHLCSLLRLVDDQNSRNKEITLGELRQSLPKEQEKLYQQKIQEIRRIKKNFFYQNSGKFKLATIHSYKGFESKVVFYVVLPQDNAELIYTAITRAKNDLYIYDLAHNEYTEFLKNNCISTESP